jgi:alpha-1,2-mannosyltransferase
MFDHKALKWIDAVAATMVLLVLTGWLLKTPVSAKGWERRDLNDYTLNLRHSREVDASHAYPFGFTYPPPSVLLRLGFGWLGFQLGGGIWIVLSGVSLLVSSLIILRTLGRLGKPGWGMLALVSLVLVKYPFEFEYKYVNSNAMFLALVLAAIALIDSRPTLAGLFLSLSIALKLYSVMFLLWLLMTRRFRAAMSTVVFSLAWFGAAPILYWGWTGAWEINAAWIQRVRETGSREFPVAYLPYAYLVSLHAMVLTLLERLPLQNSLDLALYATRGFQVVWSIAVVAALAFGRRDRGPHTRLTNIALLLLLPLPLSGQLQPHHLVVLLPGSMLLSSVAVDRSQSRGLRALSIVVLAAAFVVMEFGPRPPWRGLVVNAAVLLYFIGLVGVKRSIS